MPLGFRRQLSLLIEKPGCRLDIFCQRYLDHIPGRRHPHPHENQESEKIYKFRTGEITGT
jgi:hypothetical protein